MDRHGIARGCTADVYLVARRPEGLFGEVGIRSRGLTSIKLTLKSHTPINYMTEPLMKAKSNIFQ